MQVFILYAAALLALLSACSLSPQAPLVSTDTPSAVGSRLTPTPQPTNSAIRTAIPTAVGTPMPIVTNWKMYENLQYGFRVRYPPQFAYGMPDNIVPNREWLFNMWFYDLNRAGSSLALVVLGNPQRIKSLDTYVKTYLDPTTYLPPPDGPQIHFRSYADPQESRVAGLQALKFVDTPEGVPSPTTLILMPDNSKVIKLYYMARPDFDALATAIISTFEVIP